MSEKIKRRHKFSITFLPKEILLGFSGINSQVALEDGQIGHCYGIEIGFLFFKIMYLNY